MKENSKNVVNFIQGQLLRIHNNCCEGQMFKIAKICLLLEKKKVGLLQYSGKRERFQRCAVYPLI